MQNQRIDIIIWLFKWTIQKPVTYIFKQIKKLTK